MAMCANCARGPEGMAGHDDLFSHSMDLSQVQFKCRACGHIWARFYREQGQIEWSEPSATSPGMVLPGRSIL